MVSFLQWLIELVNNLPVVNFTTVFTQNQNFVEGVLAITNGIGFFLPISALVPILVCEIAVNMFHSKWALILRIKSFIPFFNK